jgi:CRP-like cAMP-binding protein
VRQLAETRTVIKLLVTRENTMDYVDMHAAKKVTIDQNILQEFVPLNVLSPERFWEVSEKIIIEEVLTGHYLFHKGDRDNQTIYLIEGKINLIDGFGKVISEVEAGTDMDRYAIANQQPRHLSARAVKKCVIARIDSGLLDVLLTWDQFKSAEVVEIGADDNQDWMTRILQTEAFVKIPPAIIQSLLIKMQPCPVKAGEVVIQQGDPGDYFYTIHEGRCAVTRRDSPNSEAQFLAELGSGASFGEDALVSDAKRNATISMLTDGLLMRLAKEDFIELLKNPLVRHVDYEQAAAMVDDGAVWVDVRTPDEYGYSALEDSVNIPLSCLRDELPELVFNSKYIICCDTGRRSESAGFLLSHKGFDVYVLEGGIPATSSEIMPADTSYTGKPVADVTDTDLSSQAIVDTDALQSGSGVQDEELVLLRAENEKLLAEISENQSVEARLKEQIEQQRGELCESADKLSLLYAQVQSDKVKMQLLQDQYVALQDALKEANERLSMLESDVVISEEAGTEL